MEDKQIELSENNIEKFLNDQGSPFFKLESEILGAFGKEQKQMLNSVMDSVAKIVQIVGVVAGFGFTGLGRVQNLWLFIFGEACFFATMIIGLWWVLWFYNSNLNDLDIERKKIRGLFKARRDAFAKIFNHILEQYKNSQTMFIPQDWFADLMQRGNDIQQGFESGKKDIESWSPQTLLMWFFVCGGVGLLLSFIQLSS